MVPATILSELRAGRLVRPERFADATALFCEICDMDPCGASCLAPEALVRALNAVHQTFDEVLDAHVGAFKLLTVGELFVVVCGCPIRLHGAGHAVLAARVAIAMRDAMPGLRRRCGAAGVSAQAPLVTYVSCAPDSG